MGHKIVILLVLSIVAGGCLTLSSLSVLKPPKGSGSPETVNSTTTPQNPNTPESSQSPTSNNRSTNIQSAELRVFVAASLANVVKTHTKEIFEEENNAKLLFNFGGSDSLYQQIASGSPADIFMSADFKWTHKLKTDGLLNRGQYWNLTTNKLIVILPADNPKNITSLGDLVKPGIKIVVASWTVPVGKYSNKTLTKIEQTWGDRALKTYRGVQYQNYREKIIRNIVSYEPTVSHVVSKVMLGVCDAGFAFVSDAKFQGTRLKYVEIPDAVNTKGTYGIAVVKDSGQIELASRYVSFWLSEEGQKLLADYGFGETR